MGKPKIFTPSFASLAICNFLGAMNFYLLTATFTEYSLLTYDLTHSIAALSVSVYVIGALVARVVLGGRIDRWGLKRSLIAGYAVIAATTCLYVFTLPYPVLLATRFVQGLGFGVASGAGASGAALIVPEERRSEGIGYFSMTQALATGIGPFVAIGLIGITGGYGTLFAAAAVCAVITVPLSVLTQIPDARGHAVEKNPAPKTAAPARGIGRFIHLKVVPFGLVMLMAYICYAGMITYLTLYAGEFGATDMASLYFVVYAVAILVSRPPMGRRADRRGENAVIPLTLPALALGLVVLGAAGTLHLSWLLPVSAILTGFGLGSTHSVLQAVVPKVVAPDELGRGNSTYLMMLDIGSGLGPFALGFLVPVIGYAGMYYLLAIWAVCALGLYYLVHGRQAR